MCGASASSSEEGVGGGGGGGTGLSSVSARLRSAAASEEANSGVADGGGLTGFEANQSAPVSHADKAGAYARA